MATLKMLAEPPIDGGRQMIIATSDVPEAKALGLTEEQWWAIAAGLLVAVGFAVAVGIQHWVDPKPVVMSANVTIFALLYIAAQALERLMEPLAGVLLTTQDESKMVETKLKDAKRALAENRQPDAQTALEAAANAQAQKDVKRTGRAFFYWALGTSIAFLASGGLGLYFVQLVVTSNPPVREVDMLITGLVIGGGTKPLHDLITRIEKAKTAAEDQPTVAT